MLCSKKKVEKRVKPEFEAKIHRNAIILAAGFGMRMVPINLEMPKAFLTVDGERLIERMIGQLHAAGIREIHIVVGFMKERFEYLMDRYGVDLIVNPSYASKNNLSSLALAAKHIRNTYIVPSDIWCRENPFQQDEADSWYMVSDEVDERSNVRVNRKGKLILQPKGSAGNGMIGISYLSGETACIVRDRVLAFSQDADFDDAFWEETLYTELVASDQKGGQDARKRRYRRARQWILDAKTVPCTDVVEINTYEQLRELDAHSKELESDAIDTIAQVFHVPANRITNLAVLKKGMTNRSFLFEVDADKDMEKNKRYIMRIPGVGTDRLVNRHHEAAVYRAISGRGLCDAPVYLNPDNGYKITKFLPGARPCNPFDEADVVRCMEKLRNFHMMDLQVGHAFSIFSMISFYQSLWNHTESMYEDHERTMQQVFSLKPYLDAQPKAYSLTHIDAGADNFLFYPVTDEEGNAREELQLIDWEYAGMQDPHVDLAMFCIYAMYDKEQVDHVIDIYFEGACPEDARAKIYGYIAACGLLWSNWCEYKAQLGVEFGEYSLRQYRFAKDYFHYAKERM